ncbi:MAG: hypothetical protein VXV96_07325 [Bdellovibrionota bacterium]|nr:hypothetical protein [Bdellovibrionota bacterium]
MILYHPDLGTHFKKFGINLHLRDDRADRVFETLKEKEATLAPIEIEEIERLTLNDLLLVHSRSFYEKWSDLSLLKEELKVTYDNGGDPREFDKIDLKTVERFRDHILLQGGATVLALDWALSSKFCFFLGGGMHHARIDSGSGFCPIQDIVIALRKKQEEGRIKKALVIDVDAHMGDGTSEVTKDDDSIDTLSLHMAKQWPLESELSITPSTLDITFKRGEDHLYLERLKEALQFFKERGPYDVIVVVAGADPYEKDALLSSQDLRLTRKQLLARDQMIYEFNGQVPQLWLMAGGYGDQAHSIYSQFLITLI